MSFASLFGGETLPVDRIRQWLDGAPTDTARVEAALSLDGQAQRQLFDALAGAPPPTLEHFVPHGTPDGVPVVHRGRNSLPLFTRFAKVCARTDSGDVIGYNRAGAFVETVVGPGYFVVHPRAADGDVVIDYTRPLPDRTDPWPTGWPKPLGNHERLSRWVYAGTTDVMRQVSGHVSVGRAFRAGKPLDNWFVLCREAGQPFTP